jgi:hypothetical protein
MAWLAQSASQNSQQQVLGSFSVGLLLSMSTPSKLDLRDYDHDPVRFAEAVLREVQASPETARVRQLAVELRQTWVVLLTGEGDDVAALTLLLDLEEELARTGLAPSCCRPAF